MPAARWCGLTYATSCPRKRRGWPASPGIFSIAHGLTHFARIPLGMIPTRANKITTPSAPAGYQHTGRPKAQFVSALTYTMLDAPSPPLRDRLSIGRARVTAEVRDAGDGRRLR
jgi:hypothetical protein